MVGWAAIDATGEALPAETVKLRLESDAVLRGAVGGSKYDGLRMPVGAEQTFLGVRKGLKVSSNLNPAPLYKRLQANAVDGGCYEGTML